MDAQTPPERAKNQDRHLRIDSPRDGATVAPGETLQVSVSSPDRTRFVGITVVMEDPIEIEQKATSLPARFAITIPEHIAPGSYSVSALAGRANGELVLAVIEVDIERRDMPRAITPRLPPASAAACWPEVYVLRGVNIYKLSGEPVGHPGDARSAGARPNGSADKLFHPD